MNPQMKANRNPQRKPVSISPPAPAGLVAATEAPDRGVADQHTFQVTRNGDELTN